LGEAASELDSKEAETTEKSRSKEAEKSRLKEPAPELSLADLLPGEPHAGEQEHLRLASSAAAGESAVTTAPCTIRRLWRIRHGRAVEQGKKGPPNPPWLPTF
jgi:hypothetical protein